MMQLYIKEKLAQHLNPDALSESSRGQLDELMGDPTRQVYLGANPSVIEEDDSEYSDDDKPEKINRKINKKTMVRSNTSEMEHILNKFAQKTPEMRKVKSQNKRKSVSKMMS